MIHYVICSMRNASLFPRFFFRERNMLKGRAGFTLIEVLIVLVIVGVLATLGVSQYGRTIERSRQAEATSILGALRGAQLRFAAENSGSCTNVVGNLDVDVAPGRYFDYTVPSAVPNCGDADLTTEISRATRNGAQAPATGSYNITISENGNLTCASGNCVGGP